MVHFRKYKIQFKMFAMINKLLEWFKSLFWKEEMELTLVGLQHAGKTTFVNVIASGNFNEDMIPTVGFNMRKISKGNVTIKLWDIGGQPRFRSMWERYCRWFRFYSFLSTVWKLKNFLPLRSCVKLILPFVKLRKLQFLQYHQVTGFQHKNFEKFTKITSIWNCLNGINKIFWRF